MRLSVLVVAHSGDARDRLLQDLRAHALVVRVSVADDLSALEGLAADSITNTVFISPLDYSLDEASAAIFAARQQAPGVVFVLFVNPDEVEARREEFYLGQRRRFLHYYKLDSKNLGPQFRNNLDTAIELTVYDLDWELSKESITRLRAATRSIGDSMARQVTEELLSELGGHLSGLRRRASSTWTKDHPRSVFLSHSFEDKEYAAGMKAILQSHAFIVLTGEDSNTYVTETVRRRIAEASLFISIMTPKHRLEDGSHLPSIWLIEEKALAIAAGKPLVLMVEMGVRDIGALQSDYQRIQFTPKGFADAAVRAVKQLESYVGPCPTL